MRWEELFADLELQLAAEGEAERDTEVAERIRIEDSRILWAQRLRGQLGRELDVALRSGRSVRGTLDRVAADFAVLSQGRQTSLVPLAAVVSVAGLGTAVDTTAQGVVASRLGLAAALRALARDRVVVTLHTADGQRLTGTPARVGADYLEIAVHPAEEGPRPAAVSSRRVVPFAGLDLLRALGG